MASTSTTDHPTKQPTSAPTTEEAGPHKAGAVDSAMIGAGAAAVTASDLMSAGVRAMGHAIRGSEDEAKAEDAGPSEAERTAVIEGAAAAGAEREMLSSSKAAHDHMAQAEAASSDAAVADSEEEKDACKARAEEEAKAASKLVAQSAGDASRAAAHSGHAQAAAMTG